MTLTVYPDRLRRDIAAAVANAASGVKLPAGYAVVQSAFPAGSTLELIRSGVVVFWTTLQALQVSGPKLKLGKVYGATSVFAVADIDTGTWTLRLSNGATYIEDTLTNAAGAGPFKLSGDLDPAKGFSIGDVYLALAALLDPGSDGGASSGTSSNTLNRAILGMTGQSDLIPLGLSGGWSRGGVVTQGTVPDGDSCPSWYGYPAVKALKNWQRCQLWFYVNVTTGTNRGANVRVQLRNCILQIKRRSTGQWLEIARTSSLSGDYYGADASGAPEAAAVVRNAINPGGGVEFKLSSNTQHVNIHGYGPSANISSYLGDIEDLVISLEGRLVLDNLSGADDRGTANLVINAGADYYPTMDSSTGSLGVAYLPGLGSCRFTKLSNNWDLFMFAPLRNAYEVDTSSISSATAKTVTEQAFRASPPVFSLLV